MSKKSLMHRVHDRSEDNSTYTNSLTRPREINLDRLDFNDSDNPRVIHIQDGPVTLLQNKLANCYSLDFQRKMSRTFSTSMTVIFPSGPVTLPEGSTAVVVHVQSCCLHPNSTCCPSHNNLNIEAEVASKLKRLPELVVEPLKQQTENSLPNTKHSSNALSSVNLSVASGSPISKELHSSPQKATQVLKNIPEANNSSRLRFDGLESSLQRDLCRYPSTSSENTISNYRDVRHSRTTSSSSIGANVSESESLSDADAIKKRKCDFFPADELPLTKTELMTLDLDQFHDKLAGYPEEVISKCKFWRHKLFNRMAAQRSRKRRIARVIDLKVEIAAVKNELEELQQSIREIENLSRSAEILGILPSKTRNQQSTINHRSNKPKCRLVGNQGPNSQKFL